MKSEIIFAAVVIAAAIGLLAAASNGYAKISEVTSDAGCVNGGGNQPGGQQPSCSGSGLTQ